MTCVADTALLCCSGNPTRPTQAATRTAGHTHTVEQHQYSLYSIITYRSKLFALLLPASSIFPIDIGSQNWSGLVNQHAPPGHVVTTKPTLTNSLRFWHVYRAGPSLQDSLASPQPPDNALVATVACN